MKNGEKSMYGLIMGIVHKAYMISFSDLAKKNIYPGQCAMLSALNKEDGLTQKEIAEKMHIKPPTVTVTIRRLEKAGYIDKENDPSDLRKTRIFVSEKGKKIIKEIDHISDNLQEQIFKGFTDAEMCLLRRFLNQMQDNLDEMKIDKEGLKKLDDMCCDEKISGKEM